MYKMILLQWYEAVSHEGAKRLATLDDSTATNTTTFERRGELLAKFDDGMGPVRQEEGVRRLRSRTDVLYHVEVCMRVKVEEGLVVD
jgi:hypothetical protein